MEYALLKNGIQIPRLGLGTWQITDKAAILQLLKAAWETGYTLIDTAAAYSNEMAIGKALQELGIERSRLFLSDKVWNTSRGYEQVQEACKRSLKKLKTDYLDLYLIHWPASPKLYENWKDLNAETWRGMEALLQAGLVRSIGVCNFKVHHLEELKKTASIFPMLNQFEFHPGMKQEELYDYCKKQEIAVQASSPLGNGHILENAVLQQLAQAKHISVAQLCLRYALQKGFIVIPKTNKKERLQENAAVFDLFGPDKHLV